MITIHIILQSLGVEIEHCSQYRNVCNLSQCYAVFCTWGLTLTNMFDFSQTMELFLKTSSQNALRDLNHEQRNSQHMGHCVYAFIPSFWHFCFGVLGYMGYFHCSPSSPSTSLASTLIRRASSSVKEVFQCYYLNG